MMQGKSQCAGVIMMNNRYILLVEDDDNDILLIERAFQKAGQRQMLKVARGARKRWPTSAAVMPMPTGSASRLHSWCCWIRCPASDGFEVLQWIRAEPTCKRVLVVVLTSSNLQADVGPGL